ncbi:MAG: peptidoglycan DD-metalloendopeptidase family protein [Lachnospiraceae bacterium]|nr:peptidoglycan DD-metalloendopeptidase family protein [Lachnospiraceae bacterium]
MRRHKIPRILKTLTGTAVIAAMIMGLAATAWARTPSEADLGEAQARLAALQAQQAEIQAVIDGLEDQRDDVEAYIRELDAQMEDMTDEYNELTGRLDLVSEALERSLTDTEQLEADIDEQYEAMKLRIRFMYENGETGLLDMLFSSTSLSDFLNRSEYIRELTGYDRDRLARYEEMIADLAEKRVELEALQTEIEDARAELEVQQETLELILAAKQSELEGFEAEIDAASGELHSYDGVMNAAAAEVNAIVAEIEARQLAEQQEAARQAAEAAAAAAAAAAAENPEGESAAPEQPVEVPTQLVGTIASGWTWPVPSIHHITQYYGNGHLGIDIADGRGTSYGAPIVAACSGTVVVSRWSDSAGNWVVIYHGRDGDGDQVYTCYMHCSSLCVSVGQQVSVGQTIGYIGSTGQSSGPHLHFQFRFNGMYPGAATTDPLNYVGY